MAATLAESTLGKMKTLWNVRAGLPPRVRLVEVGPRDGLQNEPAKLDAATRIEFINRLSACGFDTIEAASFVSPAWVPRMADAAAVLGGITRRPGVRYTALVPNARGLADALAAGADEIAVFPAASESFSKRNLNASIADSLRHIEPVCADARQQGLRVRGYISCAFGCPYEGAVAPAAVATLATQLRDLGCYEIALGDTIGVATPATVIPVLEAIALPAGLLAVHMHDTYGQALVNIHTALTAGIAVIDCSVAGLGGCPYAAGASGNVATEDVLYLLNGLGIETGVDLDRVIEVGAFICERLGRRSASRVANARRTTPQPS